jgi:hypothetical protein
MARPHMALMRPTIGRKPTARPDQPQPGQSAGPGK